MFSFFTQYRWAIELAGIAAAFTLVAFLIHKVFDHEQTIGYQRAVSEYTAKALLAEKAAREKELSLTKQLQEAQNAATLRDQQITKLSDTLTSTSNGLLNTINTLRSKLSKSSVEASRKQADTALSLLGECQKEYGQMAENADRHANDVRMLEEAWPQN